MKPTEQELIQRELDRLEYNAGIEIYRTPKQTSK